MTMTRTNNKPANRFTTGAIPKPSEIDGYREYQTATDKVATLRQQLAEAELNAEQLGQRQRGSEHLKAAAEQLLAGESFEAIPVRDLRGDLDALRQRIAVTKQAILIGEEAAQANKRAWANAVTAEVLPHYRRLVLAYATHLVATARAASEVRELFDDVYGACDRMLPGMAGPRLGNVNDTSSAISNIIGELVNDGLIDQADARQLMRGA